MTRLSGYVLEPIRHEGDCVLYPARRDDADQSRVLVLAPVAEPCGPATLGRLEHEYAVRAELDPAWAVRSLALSRSDERTMLPARGLWRRAAPRRAMSSRTRRVGPAAMRGIVRRSSGPPARGTPEQAGTQ